MKMRHYQVDVTVLTKLFIGSGEKLTKKEYAYDRRTLAVHIIDMKKLVKFLMQRNLLRQYERFLLDSKERDLMAWLKRMKLDSRLSEFTAYTIDNDLPLERNLNEINLFIKDAHGFPYVPGSSIKGMIRTSLIGAYYIQKNNGKEKRYAAEADQCVRALKHTRRSRRDVQRVLQHLEREGEALFAQSLFGEADDKTGNPLVRDLSKYILVSDSSPIPLNQLTLSRKVDLTYDGNERPLNLLRESLKPQTKFKFTLSLPDQIPFSTEPYPYTIKDVFNDVNLKNRVDYDFEPNRWREYSNVFRLGGGVGFQNKTFYASKFGAMNGSAITKEILKKLCPSNHKHDKNRPGESPHLLKMTWHEDDYELMGICSAQYCEI